MSSAGVPQRPAGGAPEAARDTGGYTVSEVYRSHRLERRETRRDHPTLVALSGFFAGVALVIVVPAVFAVVLRSLVGQSNATTYYPLVLLILVVPFGLLVSHRTRHFGSYLLIGVVSTAVVVLGVAALVLFILFKTQGAGGEEAANALARLGPVLGARH